MKDNEKKILSSIGDLDDRFIGDAKPRGRGKRAIAYRSIAAVASLALVVGVVLSAVLLGGGKPHLEDEPSADIPFPDLPEPGKSLAAVMEEFLQSDYGSVDMPEPEPEGGFDEWVDMPDFGTDAEAPGESGSSDSNGSYVEVTDNQVEGIIEGDLYKTTDKYIFRYRDSSLCIYSIDGDNSKKTSQTSIDTNGHKQFADMFLSEDGKTVTIIQSEYVRDTEALFYSGHNVTKLYSIDVSDVEEPRVTKTLEVSGFKKVARKIGDKIYLVTSHSVSKNKIDIDDPETYIPGISGDEEHTCELERICYPDEIKNATYSYVTVFSEAELSLSNEFAILSEVEALLTGVHFTDNHIVFEHQSGKKISEEEATSEAYSWVELIDFSGDTLRYRGSLEFRGWAEAGQYSFDEQDGYLRVVVSTRTWKRYWVEKSNASLYIFDLSTMTLAASVENFAPEGERATAVRFEGDKLYVCTAETSKFTDPVFYFDLSDYENITQVNTGYIDGFSSSLIDIGEGYLLGIGREDRTKTKLEVYKRDGESVISVAEYTLRGSYDGDYHAYLIDREKNLIGLALTYLYEDFGNGGTHAVSYGHGYFLWHFDPETESLSLALEISGSDTKTLFSYARAFVRDGYLYLTSSNEFTELVVKKVDVK